MRRLFLFLLAAALLTTPVLAADGPAEDVPAAEAPVADSPATMVPAADSPAAGISAGDGSATDLDPAVCAHYFEVSVLREATCADKGLLAYTCTKCGLTYTAETLPGGEHDYALAETTATCTKPGRATYVCTRCGDAYTEDVPAAGHVPEDAPATCTHSRSCSVCGEILEPATGHDYQYQYDAERDEEGGFISFGTWKCANCGRTLAATEGNALYYADLQKDDAADASGTDLEDDGDTVQWVDNSGTDAVVAGGESTVTSPAPDSAEEEDGEAEPDPKNTLWIIISVIALVAIVAEAVILVRSLSRKKVER